MVTREIKAEPQSRTRGSSPLHSVHTSCDWLKSITTHLMELWLQLSSEENSKCASEWVGCGLWITCLLLKCPMMRGMHVNGGFISWQEFHPWWRLRAREMTLLIYCNTSWTSAPSAYVFKKSCSYRNIIISSSVTQETVHLPGLWLNGEKGKNNVWESWWRKSLVYSTNQRLQNLVLNVYL